MSKRKRLNSSDEWPSTLTNQTEAPLVLFPNKKNAESVGALVVVYPGKPFASSTFQVPETASLSELAVLKIEKKIYRAAQLTSESGLVYMVISADTERALIQRHVREMDRKVNYRLWYENSMTQKKPMSEADQHLFGEHCFLSFPLCEALRIERCEKAEKRPRQVRGKGTYTFTLTVNISATEGAALMNGTKKLYIADKGKNNFTELVREG